METQKKKQNIYHIMRVLHRDIGFLTIGLTLVYALSGILLIYRNTDLLKTEKVEEKQRVSCNSSLASRSTHSPDAS